MTIDGVFICANNEQKVFQKFIDFSNEISSAMLTNVHNEMESKKLRSCELPEVKSMKYKDTPIPTQIKAIKGRGRECHSFMVADKKSILVNSRQGIKAAHGTKTRGNKIQAETM